MGQAANQMTIKLFSEIKKKIKEKLAKKKEKTDK